MYIPYQSFISHFDFIYDFHDNFKWLLSTIFPLLCFHYDAWFMLENNNNISKVSVILFPKIYSVNYKMRIQICVMSNMVY